MERFSSAIIVKSVFFVVRDTIVSAIPMPCELKKMLSVCRVPNHPGKHEDIFESALQFFFGRLGKEWCFFLCEAVSNRSNMVWFGQRLKRRFDSDIFREW